MDFWRGKVTDILIIFNLFLVFETYEDGSYFEGIYQNGKRNGKGMIIIATKYKIEGNFIENFLEGEGKFQRKKYKLIFLK